MAGCSVTVRTAPSRRHMTNQLSARKWGVVAFLKRPGECLHTCRFVIDEFICAGGGFGGTATLERMIGVPAVVGECA